MLVALRCDAKPTPLDGEQHPCHVAVVGAVGGGQVQRGLERRRQLLELGEGVLQ